MQIRFDTLDRGPHDRAALLASWGFQFDPERHNDERCMFVDAHHIALFLTIENRGSRHSTRTYFNKFDESHDKVRMEINRGAKDDNQRLESSPGKRNVGIFYRQKTGQLYDFDGIYEYRGKDTKYIKNATFYLFERISAPASKGSQG